MKGEYIPGEPLDLVRGEDGSLGEPQAMTYRKDRRYINIQVGASTHTRREWCVGRVKWFWYRCQFWRFDKMRGFNVLKQKEMGVVECTACLSSNVKRGQYPAKVPGRWKLVLLRIDICRSCGTQGDFARCNDQIIMKSKKWD